jgi:eukaryotic-like serine/threonine-protein kinase
MSDDGRLVAGRYRLGERLGKGGMGIVWKAYDERLRRSVAVKELLLPAHLSGEEAEQAKLRAMRESRIAARILHPNVIAIYDVVEADAHPCLVMEFLESKSLSETVAERGPLPPREVAHIGAQAARALRAAHVAGVVHRDVKPGNVLLGEGGIAKLADFGISRAAGDITVTATGLISGTPAYIAPEVAKGREATFASDVFSLGSTLYAAVEGNPPFGPADNAIALLYRVASGELNPPRHAGPLTDVLLELLRTDPDRRPTMGVAAERLTAVAAGRSGPRLAPGTPVVLPPERTSTLPAVEFRETGGPAHGRGSAPAAAAGTPTQRPDRTPVAGAEAGGAPGSFAPTIRTPQESTPQGPGPQEPGHRESLPRESVPQEYASPEPMRQEYVAPESMRQEYASPEPVRQESARQESVPREPTPREAAPWEAAAWESAPREAANEPRANRSGGKGRRKGGGGVILGVLAVLAAASLVTVILLDQAARDRETQPPPATQQTPSNSESPPERASPEPSSPPQPAEASTPTKAVTEYYDLMPEDPEEGFSRLSASYQQAAGGYSGYTGFWRSIEDVSVSDVTANGRRVEADISYVNNAGERSSERRSFTMVEQDGRWFIDDSEVI